MPVSRGGGGMIGISCRWNSSNAIKRGSIPVGYINLAPASGSRRLTSTSAGCDRCPCHTTVDVILLSVKVGKDERRRRKVIVNQSHVDGTHFLWELLPPLRR